MRNEREEAMSREAVIVALDAKRRKGSVEIVEWAFKYLVRPGDILLVLGLLDDELGHPKKQSCFPFFFFATGACERSEMVDDDDLDSVVIKETYKKRRGEYEIGLQTINRLCQSNKVKLQVKFAVGYRPASLAIEQARDLNTRWILMDSHFRESRFYLRGHVSCNIAVMKNKYLATLMLSNNATPTHSFPDNIRGESYNAQRPVEVPSKSLSPDDLRMSPAPPPYRQNPCCYPVSWRTGFPRVFSHSEVEAITNGFADDYVEKELAGVRVKIYQGILQDTTVIVKCYEEVNKGFWSLLKILSRVYHRNIMNLIGYCYTGATAYLVFDFPCLGKLETNFQIEELANKLGWETRWCIALEIGRSLRYLHEECADGPIIHKSVCSCNVTLSHNYSAMLANLRDAEWLDGGVPCDEDSVAKYSNSEEDERLFVDVRGYGKFLLELITGKNACSFLNQGKKDQSLIDWAIPQLQNGVLKELMDCRVTETAGDPRMVRQMAHAALCCLNVDADHKLSISEAVAIVRGDELVVSIEALKI